MEIYGNHGCVLYIVVTYCTRYIREREGGRERERERESEREREREMGQTLYM